MTNAKRLTFAEHIAFAKRFRAHLNETIAIGRALEGRGYFKTKRAWCRVHVAMQALQSELDGEWYRLPESEREAASPEHRAPYYNQQILDEA